jgi:uncharacterized membrane protein
MGYKNGMDYSHLATLLATAASLSACDAQQERTSGAVRYDAEDRGLVMAEPQKASREKCYGIALAQMNDCAAGPKTDCAGTATEDYLPDRWKYVSPGECITLGGTLEPGEPKPEPSGK